MSLKADGSAFWPHLQFDDSSWGQSLNFGKEGRKLVRVSFWSLVTDCILDAFKSWSGVCSNEVVDLRSGINPEPRGAWVFSTLRGHLRSLLYLSKTRSAQTDGPSFTLHSPLSASA